MYRIRIQLQYIYDFVVIKSITLAIEASLLHWTQFSWLWSLAIQFTAQTIEFPTTCEIARQLPSLTKMWNPIIFHLHRRLVKFARNAFNRISIFNGFYPTSIVTHQPLPTFLPHPSLVFLIFMTFAWISIKQEVGHCFVLNGVLHYFSWFSLVFGFHLRTLPPPSNYHKNSLSLN